MSLQKEDILEQAERDVQLACWVEQDQDADQSAEQAVDGLALEVSPW